MKNMTFRRVKKLNSSDPDSGSLCHDSGDIYFTSSKSDSCGIVNRGPSNSTEVYNYKTLAYSGGTLPRNFKKVSISFVLRFSFLCLIAYCLHCQTIGFCYDIYLHTFSLGARSETVFWIVLDQFTYNLVRPAKTSFKTR